MTNNCEDEKFVRISLRMKLRLWVYLKRNAPEGVKANARIDNAIGVGRHQVKDVRSGTVQLPGVQRLVVDRSDQTDAHFHRYERHLPIEMRARYSRWKNTCLFLVLILFLKFNYLQTSVDPNRPSAYKYGFPSNTSDISVCTECDNNPPKRSGPANPAISDTNRKTPIE